MLQEQLDEIKIQAISHTKRYHYFRSPYLGAIPVLLLPGLFADDWIWDATIPSLQEKDFSFIVIRESFASIGGTVEELRHYVKEILNELNLYQCHVVGNSYGGLVAFDLAATYPERVHSIIASGTPGMGNTINLGVGVSRPITREFAAKVAGKIFYDQRCLTEAMIDHTLSIFSNNRTVLNMIRLMKTERTYDVHALLPRITCDTLLLWGQDDIVTPLAEWERNAHLFAKGQVKVITECGHTPMIEKPSEFHAIMLDFLTTTCREGV